MTDERLSTAYDIGAHPHADGFDPISWFEGTGEDLGVPADYMERYNAAVVPERTALKYSEDQLRDWHGRWSADGGGGPEAPESIRTATAAFSSMPETSRNTTGAAHAWMKENEGLYASNHDFRVAVDAAAAYSRGNYSEVRGGAEYAMTGIMPSSDHTGYNDEYWHAAMDFQGRQQLVLGEMRDIPPPGVSPLEHLTDYGRPETGGEGVKTFGDRASYREAGTTLNAIIAASDRVEEPLYRAFALRGNFSVNADGNMVEDAGRRRDWDHPGVYIDNPGKPYLAVGQTLDLMGPSSYTKDEALADRIVAGRQKMGDFYLNAGSAGLIFKVEGAQAVNIQALSPYKQAEYLTGGRFTVASIMEGSSAMTVGHSGLPGRGGSYISVFYVTLRQEGTWSPPTT